MSLDSMTERTSAVRWPYGHPPLDSEGTLRLKVDKATRLLNYGNRVDGREHYEARPVFIRTNVSSNACGSCYLSQRNTNILCRVFGPKPLSRNNAQETKISVDKGSLEFQVTFSPFCFNGKTNDNKGSGLTQRIFRENRNVNGTDEEERLTSRLAETFQSVVLFQHLPYTSVEVCLIITRSEGGLTSAAINCVAAALADAGIPMKDLCVSVTVALLPQCPPPSAKASLNAGEPLSDHAQESGSSLILVDPTDEELEAPENALAEAPSEEKYPLHFSRVYLAHCISDSTVALMDIEGVFLLNELSNVLGLAEASCIQLAQQFRDQLRQQVNQKRRTDHMEAVVANKLFTKINSSPPLTSHVCENSEHDNVTELSSQTLPNAVFKE